jgi:hypothetical protein
MKARMENPALILPGALEALRAVHAAKKKRSSRTREVSKR